MAEFLWGAAQCLCSPKWVAQSDWSSQAAFLCPLKRRLSLWPRFLSSVQAVRSAGEVLLGWYWPIWPWGPHSQSGFSTLVRPPMWCSQPSCPESQELALCPPQAAWKEDPGTLGRLRLQEGPRVPGGRSQRLTETWKWKCTTWKGKSTTWKGKSTVCGNWFSSKKYW